MNKSRELVEMGEFYKSSVFTESVKNVQSKKATKKGFPKDTFPTSGKTIDGDTVKTTKAFDKAGPNANKNKEALKAPLEPGSKQTFTGVENFSQESKKIQKENINTFMNKSIFDELFENVMSGAPMSQDDVEHTDAEALDLPGHEEMPGDEGEVTITLDKETAKKLHDVLMSVLGEEEPESEEHEGEDESDSMESEDEEVAFEATDIKELSDEHGKKLISKGAHKVASTVTSDVDGKEGSGDSQGIVNDGKPQPLKKVVGGGVPSNKVAGKVTSGVKKDLFAAAK